MGAVIGHRHSTRGRPWRREARPSPRHRRDVVFSRPRGSTAPSIAGWPTSTSLSSSQWWMATALLTCADGARPWICSGSRSSKWWRCSRRVLPARSRGHLEHTVRVFDPFCEVRVRHQAPCGRTRMRDPPLRAVAAIQRSWEHRYLGGARSVGSSPDNDRDGSALPDGQALASKGREA